MKTIADMFYAIALILWIGGMWVAGFAIAPVLFKTLDRALAGMVAGKMFAIIAYIGMGCAAYLLIFHLIRYGGGAFRQASFWLIMLMVALVAAGQFGITPILEELKVQALPHYVMDTPFRGRFDLWHHLSSMLYAAVSLLGVLLAYRETRRPR